LPTQSKKTKVSVPDRLRRLSEYLMQLEGEERLRLSQELKDSAGHKLEAVKTNLDVLARRRKLRAEHQDICEIIGLVEEAAREIQRMAQDLRSPLLDEAALSRHLAGEETSLPVTPKTKKRANEIAIAMAAAPDSDVAHDSECGSTRNAARCRMPGTVPPEPASLSSSRAALPAEISDKEKDQSSEQLPPRQPAKHGWFRRVLGFRRPERPGISTLVRANPLADSAGNVRGAVAAYFDLTNLKMVEQRLREHAQLLELASEAVIARDHRGVVQLWNAGAEALYGWTRGEMIGRNLHQVLATRFPVSQHAIRESITRTGKWEGNLIQRTKDGREVTVACREALALGYEPHPVILEVSRDVTAQLQSQEILRQTEKWAAMGRVAGVIAHEINNPLDSIVNALFLLNNHSSLDAEARQYLGIANEELSRVVHITKQALGFYRESQQAVRVSLPALLDGVLDLQSRALRRHGISERKVYRTNGVILGFPVELKQVFLNLISNAIEAMPEGGQLRLHVFDCVEKKTQRRGVRVSITDTGSGVKREDARRIFQPFFSTKSAKGTGLGLWITKGIVQKYEGTLRFRSLRLRRACTTCFSVFFPGSKAEAAENSVEESRDVA
jgi:PAS domain S-box-containing protein